MGPMASALFYEILTEMTPAEKDQDHIETVILSDPLVPDRTAAILSEDERDRMAVEKRIARDIAVLKQAGCTELVVTCNTSHFFLDRMGSAVPLPVVHLIGETVEAVKTLDGNSAGNGPVAVLATDGTIRTRIYQNALEAEDMEAWLPDASCQKMVMSVIYDYVKRGKPVPLELWKSIDERVHEAGCRNAILGCTELSVLKKDLELDSHYVDPLVIAALRVIEHAHCQ